MFATGNEPLRARNSLFSIFQLTQEKVPNSTAAAAKPQPANAATRYDLIVLCLVRNSCRKRISTRDGVSASLVSAPNSRKSPRSACQFSCKLAQCEQSNRCSRAACCNGPSAFPSPRSKPAMANSSQFIPTSPSSNLTAGSCAFWNVAQNFEFGQQQCASTMQARTNRPDGAIQRLRGFFVAQFFQ